MEQLYTGRGIAKHLSAIGFGHDEDIFRALRHYTNNGLIRTHGAVHTGTGRNRTYPPDAILECAVLLRLNQLQIPVGIMKDLMRGLSSHLKKEHDGLSLLAAAIQMDEPCLFLVIPDGSKRTLSTAARLFERVRLDDLPPGIDLVMVQLKRILP